MKASAIAALVALGAPSGAGWVLALHLADHDHANPASPMQEGGVVGLEIVLHGHSHAAGTPPHGHALMTSRTAPIPGKLLIPVIAGDAPIIVDRLSSGRRPLSPRRPTHDPPSRLASLSVLRI